AAGQAEAGSVVGWAESARPTIRGRWASQTRPTLHEQEYGSRMSTGEPLEPTIDGGQPAATPAHLAYAGASRVETAGNQSRVELFGNLDRPPVRFAARVKDPLRFREALSALYAVVGSDYRYVPKDRTAYLAYLPLKRATAGP